jgi:hypothetical protein
MVDKLELEQDFLGVFSALSANYHLKIALSSSVITS